MNTKRIRSVTTLHDDGAHAAHRLDFLDGSVLDPPGVIANHVAANACGDAPLPTTAVLFSVLRDPGNRRRRHSNDLLADAGHYAASMAKAWARGTATNPGCWQVAATRTWGVYGTLASNLDLLRETQMSGGHALVAQPPQDADARMILDQVGDLRDHQRTHAPSNGHEVDILAHVPFASVDDVDSVMDVALQEPAFFLDLHGANPKVIGGLNVLRDQMANLQGAKPWIGATQVKDFTTPAGVLTSAILNVLGVMASVQWLGGVPPGMGDDDGVLVANKKQWPLPGSGHGVARALLPPGTLSKAPQAVGLDLTDDRAVDRTVGMFDVNRTHVLMEARHEAVQFFRALSRGRVLHDYLELRPAVKALVT